MNAAIVFAFLGLMNSAGVFNDCGASESAALIGKTQLLILKKESIVVPTSPAPTRPSLHCVRLTFRIDREGKASGIQEAASSGNFKLVASARAALERYAFDAEHADAQSHYSLVFFEMVD